MNHFYVLVNVYFLLISKPITHKTYFTLHHITYAAYIYYLISLSVLLSPKYLICLTFYIHILPLRSFPYTITTKTYLINRSCSTTSSNEVHAFSFIYF